MDNKTDSSAAILFEQGLRCFHKPDGIGAVKAFRQLIAMDPSYVHTDGDNPLFYMGKIHEIEGDLEQAITMYTRSLALDQWDEESLIGRGSCYTVLNRDLEAIADFKRLLSLGHGLRKVADHMLFYAIAENHRKQAQWRKALTWGKKALADEPENQRYVALVKEATTNIGKA